MLPVETLHFEISNLSIVSDRRNPKENKWKQNLPLAPLLLVPVPSLWFWYANTGFLSQSYCSQFTTNPFEFNLQWLSKRY